MWSCGSFWPTVVFLLRENPCRLKNFSSYPLLATNSLSPWWNSRVWAEWHPWWYSSFLLSAPVSKRPVSPPCQEALPFCHHQWVSFSQLLFVIGLFVFFQYRILASSTENFLAAARIVAPLSLFHHLEFEGYIETPFSMCTRASFHVACNLQLLVTVLTLGYN